MKYSTIITMILLVLAAFSLLALPYCAPAFAASAKRKAANFCAGLRAQFFTPLIQAANTYDAAVEVHDCAVTRTNDAAVTARHLLWQIGASGTAVDVNIATTCPLGTIDNTETATGMRQSVLLLGKGPTKKMVANEAITAGEQVFTAAAGKVQDTPTGATVYLVGTALTAAAADGDIIEVQDCTPVKLTFA